MRGKSAGTARLNATISALPLHNTARRQAFGHIDEALVFGAPETDAQVLLSDDELADKLAKRRAADTAKVLAANAEVEAKYNC